MEVDPAYARRRLPASLGIGFTSFARAVPRRLASVYVLIGWTLKASLIAGTALSTTSLAVVYAALLVAKMIPKLAFILPLARRASPSTRRSLHSS
jgi:Kef-type K+ transport system membrane component KefB